MAGIDDINVNFDIDDKKINIDDNILETNTNSNIEVKKDDNLYGVDLLANKNYSSGNSDNDGYSSGEDPSKKEDYDFFKDKEEKEKENTLLPENKEETKSIPLDDPLVNEKKGHENGGFKSLGSMYALYTSIKVPH